MPIVKIKKTKNYTYAFWRIEENTSNLLKQLQAEEDELYEITRINHLKRKQQNIVARLILNHLSMKKVKLCYLESGAPYCKNFKYISISHSKDYCVVITSENSIGIDIQYKKPNIEQLSEKFINKLDKKYIINANSIIELHFIWCAKEAIYKTLNNTSCSFKEDIYIEGSKNKITTSGYYNSNRKRIKYNIYYDRLENYFIAIVKKYYD